MSAPTLYSVYDHGTKRYTYYRGPGDGATHAGAPKIRSSNDLGATVDQAAWTLPAGSVKVGSGEMPMGKIASVGGMGAWSSSDGVTLALFGLAAYVAWKVLK